MAENQAPEVRTLRRRLPQPAKLHVLERRERRPSGGRGTAPPPQEGLRLLRG